MGMGGADLEVVEACSPPQGHGAPAVGDVVAQAEVARVARPSGDRLGGRPVRLGRGGPADRPVRTLLVVGEAEGVELRLQLDGAGHRWPGPEPALEGLMEALDLALGLGVSGCPVLLVDAEVGEEVLEPVCGGVRIEGNEAPSEDCRSSPSTRIVVAGCASPLEPWAVTRR